MAEGEARRRRARGAGSDGARTIREVAREAGVSTATVSRVFNQPDKVRPETRAAVLTVAERLSFVFDGNAAGLASRRSRTLGLVIPTIMNSIYAASTQSLQSAAQEAGYTVLVGIAEFSRQREAELIHRLLERRVDGLILTGSTRDAETYAKIERLEVPFVVTWRLTPQGAPPSVAFDNGRAARTAVEHLLSLGHRRIGLICGRSDLNDRALDRRLAYEATLRDAGIEPDPALVFERDFEYVEGRAAMHRLLQLADPPSAVFCANDVQAVGALTECHDLGVRVPEDLSIVGFDDQAVAQLCNPRLTTIRVPAAEMGRRAAQGLIAHLDEGRPLATQELQTQLVLRQTTAPPARR